MSIVKDMSLAPSGHQKIQWVRDFMPALSGIEERFRREKPFQGLTIAVSVHLEAKTANLGLVLREGGADVHLTGCNPLSTQDDVAAAMADLGVETFGVHGVDMQGYEDLLVETLKCRPHLIVDDGGDLIQLLGGGRFHQIAQRADLIPVKDIVGMPGDKDDGQAAVHLPQAAAGVNAVYARHVHVHEEKVELPAVVP